MGEFIGLVAVLMVFGIPMLAIWTKHQSTMREQDASFADGQARQLAMQVEALQDRVEVLERIITDRSHDVAAQIEALRDLPVTDRDSAKQR